MPTGGGSLACFWIYQKFQVIISIGWCGGLGSGRFRMSIAEDGIDGGCFCLLIPSFASEAKRKHTDCMGTCSQ
jgi:hypothetical protein